MEVTRGDAHKRGNGRTGQKDGGEGPGGTGVNQPLPQACQSKQVALLTLAKHRSGIWVTTLVDRLQLIDPHVDVVVIDIDSITIDLIQPDLPWAMVVNRVSDAAPPAITKATIALLTAAEMKGIPVINGVKPYCIGMNKVAHHVVLDAV